eukprot:COSAG05_NODE_4511_length_1483_cov_2.049133_1_plen_77_part_00
MSVLRDVAERVVAIGSSGVRAQASPLVTDCGEAGMIVVVVVAVRLVRQVVGLAKEDGLRVGAAVAAVVADRLNGFT